jgi:hypothetical protein
MFIGGWALNELIGMLAVAPTAAGISTDSMGAIQLEYTVSGSSGDSSLSISAGDQTKGTGTWSAILKHDDNTYGAYIVSNLGSNVCTIFPNLRATVTSKTLRNLGGTINGQHYTEPGFRALANFIWNSTRRATYRNRYAAQWRGSLGVKADWTNIGGLTSGQYAIATTNNVIGLTTAKESNAFISRSRTTLTFNGASVRTGKGVTKTFSLGGKSGVLEMLVSCGLIGAVAGGAFYPFHVNAKVDGVDIFDQTFVRNDGLVRILVDFPSGTSGVVTVTYSDDTGPTNTTGYVDCVNWWTYDRVPNGFAWTDRVIDKNGNVVILGDSWSTFYPTVPGQSDGALGQELQSLMTAAGGTGTVTSVGVAGTTAEYGLANFNTVVAPLNPTQVIIEFFTNDRNQYGDANYQRWLNALYAIGQKCQAIGAEPIFISPLQTSSLSQAIVHGIWADRLGVGLPA